MNPHRRHLIATATAVAVTLAGGLPTAFAQEQRGTKDEAKTLNDAAVAHIKKVGVDQAVKDFADKSKWMNKDLYPFVMDFSGVMRYHLAEKMVGKYSLDVKDASGHEFGRDMLKVAQSKGSGWVDYEWAHPVTKKVEDKTAYVQRVAGADLFVGVGFYR